MTIKTIPHMYDVVGKTIEPNADGNYVIHDQRECDPIYNINQPKTTELHTERPSPNPQEVYNDLNGRVQEVLVNNLTVVLFTSFVIIAGENGEYSGYIRVRHAQISSTQPTPAGKAYYKGQKQRQEDARRESIYGVTPTIKRDKLGQPYASDALPTHTPTPSTGADTEAGYYTPPAPVIAPPPFHLLPRRNKPRPQQVQETVVITETQDNYSNLGDVATMAVIGGLVGGTTGAVVAGLATHALTNKKTTTTRTQVAVNGIITRRDGLFESA
ncbi:MAG: hypothetical protein K8953_00370 [Proteobacteria bacterium]|nr:hypothetical protein [Pseudomonadota bacterium]